MSNQVGKVHKVSMDLTSNLHAYPYKAGVDANGKVGNDREGDNMTGINTGSANQDLKADPAQGCGKSYRIDAIIK